MCEQFMLRYSEQVQSLTSKTIFCKILTLDYLEQLDTAQLAGRLFRHSKWL